MDVCYYPCTMYIHCWLSMYSMLLSIYTLLTSGMLLSMYIHCWLSTCYYHVYTLLIIHVCYYPYIHCWLSTYVIIHVYKLIDYPHTLLLIVNTIHKCYYPCRYIVHYSHVLPSMYIHCWLSTYVTIHVYTLFTIHICYYPVGSNQRL